MLKNMKVVTKLYIGFGLAIVFALILGGIGIFATYTVIERGNAALDDVYYPMFYLEQTVYEYADFFYWTKDATSTDDMERKAVAYESSKANIETILANIDMYIEFLYIDNYVDLDNYVYNEEYELLLEIRGFFANIDSAVDVYFDLCMNEPESALAYYDVHIDEPTERIDEIYDRLVEISNKWMKDEQAAQKRNRFITTVTLGVLMLVSFIILLASSIYNTRLVKKSIRRMLEATDNMANGKLNINLDTSSKDEFGILSANLQRVIRTLETLIIDLNHMAEKHKDGETNEFIDSNNYSGSYREVAAGINEMVMDYKDDIETVLSSIGSFAEGNFDVEIREFPGNKAQYKNVIDEVGKKLKSINDEIKNLVNKASHGIFNEYAREDGFSFGWKEVISNLNQLLDQVSNPLGEVSNVLNSMSAGNFATRVNGDYMGSFKMVKDSLNEMADSISGYISEISNTLNLISEGELNFEVDREYVGDFYAIKVSLNQIVDNLNETMSNISVSSHQTASGARQMSDSANLLASGAAEQSQAVDSLNGLMESLNEKNKNNTDNTATAMSASIQALGNSDEGTQKMDDLLVAMEQIKEASDSISSIIKVIEDVSFQTNLLSLNASVEAARAGEHGKGFAVVAGEVRTLAHRSQEAAKDSAKLINNAVSKANMGMEIASATSETLAKIVADVGEVSSIIEQISASTEEQSKALDEATFQLKRILETTTNNVAVSEESAASAEELSSQSDMLSNMVSQFRLR